MINLSIVIPSYNRNDTLLTSLPIVLDQLRPGVELCILDNSSKVPLAKTLEPLLAKYQHVDVKIVRHITNIGGDANILRSFEMARYPWIWILGDDDIVSADAVDIVIQTIQDNSDCIFFNFITASMRERNLRRNSYCTSGQADFVERLDYPGNINFMSVGVWNVAAALKGLANAYKYTYSMSTIFVILLTVLRKDGLCFFSDQVIVDTVTTADAATKWQFGDFILGWNTILELPMSKQTRVILSRKMYSWHKPENACVYLLAEAVMQKSDGHKYTLVKNRLAAYISFSERMRYRLYKPFFWAPSLSWPIVSAIIALTVKLKIKSIDLPDIVDRAGFPK